MGKGEALQTSGNILEGWNSFPNQIAIQVKLLSVPTVIFSPSAALKL